MNTNEKPKPSPEQMEASARRKAAKEMNRIRRTDYGDPVDQIFALKIKVKSLSAEAGFIRSAERKTRSYGKYISLHSHRVKNVRRASRYTLIAYGYVRGRTFEQCEQNTAKNSMGDILILRDKDFAVHVAGMVRKYGPPSMMNTTPTDIVDWVTGRSPVPKGFVPATV